MIYVIGIISAYIVIRYLVLLDNEDGPAAWQVGLSLLVLIVPIYLLIVMATATLVSHGLCRLKFNVIV